MGAAEARWAEQLAGWAIPDEILAQAAADPWKLTPNLFPAPEAEDEPPETTSLRAAREALGEGGTVIDVGVGGGAASLPLAPPATVITGVDISDEMLKAFSEAAKKRGVKSRFFAGRWPDNARAVPPADVVMSNHVFYNVADLERFAVALTAHARRRVVVEITGRHPVAATNALWKRFWDLDRPEGPTADDAIAVLREAGIEPEVEREMRPRRRPVLHADRLAFLTRRLCLPPDRQPEVEVALEETPEPAEWEVVTLWWPGGVPTPPPED
jgi:SAM-dependent methyltransferase